ncbi:MAG TPA: hypothetical protein VFG05_10705 [Methylocella sp.]|nr:hypothetical protein [Methylocella sp.]
MTASNQSQNGAGIESVSLTWDEIKKIKRAICDGRPYTDRMSFAMACRLMDLKNNRSREYESVLREIRFLEGIAPSSVTKAASQFKRPPLHPFWHKHFYAPRHFLANLGARWGFQRGGNKDLMKLIEDVALRHCHGPEELQSVLPHHLVMDGWKDRASFGLTGDWIIFAKHDGKNYYLDLASHKEGDQPDALMTKLRSGCAAEFPFLFNE